MPKKSAAITLFVFKTVCNSACRSHRDKKSFEIKTASIWANKQTHTKTFSVNDKSDKTTE